MVGTAVGNRQLEGQGTGGNLMLRGAVQGGKHLADGE